MAIRVGRIGQINGCMNLVLSFLSENWLRLNLQRFGDASRLSGVMMTPRFRASSHVICFVLSGSKTDPIFVVKMPRLPGDHERLDREAANLRFAQHARPAADRSIPQVLAYEDFHRHRLLIETAVPGRPMSPAIVRRHPDICLEAAFTWLLDLHLATKNSGARDEGDWFQRLVEQPLQRFKTLLPPSAEEARFVDQTLAAVRPLRDHGVPLVMEHGDFSSPNILQDENGSVGVVDWELAEPKGLPAADLFFFLTYVAFVRQNARKNLDYLKAFRHAFFGTQAWASSYVMRYCERLNLAPQTLAPLFVATWGRYVAGLVARLQNAGEASGTVGNETVKWLRLNRYYVLWRHAIAGLREFALAGSAH